MEHFLEKNFVETGLYQNWKNYSYTLFQSGSWQEKSRFENHPESKEMMLGLSVFLHIKQIANCQKVYTDNKNEEAKNDFFNHYSMKSEKKKIKLWKLFTNEIIRYFRVFLYGWANLSMLQISNWNCRKEINYSFKFFYYIQYLDFNYI